MGYVHRLRQGISNLFKPSGTYEARNMGRNSLDVHQLRLATTGFSQPVWGPEISTVGNYSREGYTSRTFDLPVQPFSKMVIAMETDEDVQLAINGLASQITGGAHYWKGKDQAISDYIHKFSKRIDFDQFDTTIVKELLAYGNSVWKPRCAIGDVKSKDDLMHIPISSFVRIWWDRARKPYKYEFRGSEYQGYHNPDEVMHFVWNPVDASAFGLGLIVAMVAPRQFEQITSEGPELNELPSMLDRKYSNQLTMHLTERRYIPRNVFIAKEAEQEERDQLRADLANLSPNEDFVFGKDVSVQELGAVQRAFDPTLFNETIQGPIMRALNDFRGKQAAESSHQYANAETSKVLQEIGLASFPLAVTSQLIKFLFQPWYEANPIPDAEFQESVFESIGMPWEDCEFELNFGEVEKTDLEVKDMQVLIDSAVANGAVSDPMELRDLYERAGLPLSKEFTDAMVQQQEFNQQAMPQDWSGMNVPAQEGEVPYWNTAGADQTSRPMDNEIYNDMSVNVRPTDPRLNFTLKRKKKKQ